MRLAAIVFAALAPLAAAQVTPVSVCAGCHRAEASGQPESNMAKALMTGAQSPALRQHARLTFSDGRFSYEIERLGNGSAYTVREGDEKLTVPIDWAFGSGAAGQTFLLTLNGKWYESRVSYYKAIDGLDYTLGARGLAPKNITEALGQERGPRELAQCFGCHTTNSVKGGAVDFEHITPGVLCESCHQSAEKHAQAMRAGDAQAAGLPHLGKLAPEEIFDFCGKCHRTWSTIASQGPMGIQNVRFQPYRLTNSKCFDADDRRISCVACHDPHAHQKRSAAFYDSKCGQCHRAPAKVCPVAAKDCVSCHMPQVEIPDSHHLFTDHQIRVAKAGSPYPN